MNILQSFSPGFDVAELSDSELMMAATVINSIWKEVDEPNRDIGDWDRDSLLEAHDAVTAEIGRRNLPAPGFEEIDQSAMPDFLFDRDAVLWAFEQEGEMIMSERDIREKAELPKWQFDDAVEQLQESGDVEEFADSPTDGILWKLTPEQEADSTPESEQPDPEKVDAIATQIIRESPVFATKDSIENLGDWR